VKLLLDTHTLLWMSLDDSQLSENARELLADLTNDLFISPASYWEIAIKISLGKYQLTEPLDVFVDREIANNDIAVLPIKTQHAQFLTTLPFPRDHKDPFDRLLIAQATVEQMGIVSKDGKFDAYGVKRLW
jgi:PIN domain nuclease of toxin-antitoxin system